MLSASSSREIHLRGTHSNTKDLLRSVCIAHVSETDAGDVRRQRCLIKCLHDLWEAAYDQTICAAIMSEKVELSTFKD